jgi:hypothetical protein
MSMQVVQSKPLYPKKVLIPDEYLEGNPEADIIKSRVEEYYYFRDMIWEMIFIERTNPYTGKPYFVFSKPSVHNEYEWLDILQSRYFSYCIECNIPTHLQNHVETGYLYILHSFDVPPRLTTARYIDIHFTLYPIEGMRTSDSIDLRLFFSSLGPNNARHHKDYLRVWFSSIYNSYKVLFLNTPNPSTWGAVMNYVSEKCSKFSDYVHGWKSKDQQNREKMILHFLLKGNSQSSPWLTEIQRDDIARMIWREAEILPGFMQKLCTT